MALKGITLRGLEVFEALASTGSVARTAVLTGLSQPAVSQQIRNLEAALEIALVDHGRRPMHLTTAGSLFLARVENALKQLRLAQSELTVMDLAHLKALDIGIIDDFDDNLTPRLATILSDSLKGCRFKMVTASSYDLITALNEKRLHMVICANTGTQSSDTCELPLANDPYIIVTPADCTLDPAKLPDPAGLPFLRYDKAQLISHQIDAHLTRHRVVYPERFEIGSHLALMAMVARGIGWTITTPLGFRRASRFGDQLNASPLPMPPLARRISLFASADWAGNVPGEVARTMRRLIGTHMVDPMLSEHPFLLGNLRILGETG